MRRRSWPNLLACCLLLAASGCATWSSPPDEPTQLPSGRVAPDSVLLEVALVRLPEDWEQDGAFWQDVDEQHLPSDMRRQLQDNGLRSGILGSQIPPVLRASLEQSADPLEALLTEESPQDSELFAKKRRLHIRPGNPRRIPVTATGTNAAVVLFTEDAAVRALRFEKPLGMVELSCEPLGDGRVRLGVLPAVEHGELRQQWGTAEGSWMMYSSRPRHLFESLAFRTVLSPGQTLVLTAADAKGLGGEFFARLESQQRSMLLVRLAQTQWDDLFHPVVPRRPLATTATAAAW